jgi:hypothetical protein
MRLPTWVWVVWAALGLALEVAAIATDAAGDTLTESILLLPALVVWLALLWVAQHFAVRLLRRRRG